MPEDMLGKEVKVSITKNATGQYSARMYLLDGVTITHDETIYFGDESIIVTAGGGVAFKGPEDTIYKGFEFSYNGPELATPIAPGTTVSEQGFKMSQGVADFLTKGLEAMIMLTVSSDKEIDQKNELNRIALHVKQKKISQEKRLKDMQDKHAKIIEREKRKAERFQERFEKIQKLSMGLQSLTAFWRG
jgi:hypothetical protein